MSDRELRDELVTLLVAGHETTATALAWTVERLIRTEGGWDRLRAGGEEYAEAAGKEALRLRPVLPVVLRHLQRDMTIAGHDLPAGTVVAPCIRSCTAAPRSTRSRRASCPSASSAPSRRAGRTRGSRSAAACAGASARPSRSWSCKIVLAEMAAALELAPARPEMEPTEPPDDHAGARARCRGARGPGVRGAVELALAPAMADAPRELFLIDGNSLAYRAFFALPESIATSDGRPTNAIFGFASMLVKILTDHGDVPTVVVWDAGMSGRKEISADYKAQRSSRPDLLKQQWPALHPLVEAFGYPNVSVEGYEADDVIAALTEQARAPGHPGDGRHRRPRRLPARHGRRADHDDVARDHRHEGLRPPGRDRPLRHPARARAGLHRPQGRHVGQHPGRPGHRRQDRGRAAAALRLARGGARERRRDLGRQAQAEPDGARRGRARLQAAGDDGPRRPGRDRPPGRARPRAGPLAAARDLPRVRAARPAAPARGGARRRRVGRDPAARGRHARGPSPPARARAADVARLTGARARARRRRAGDPRGRAAGARERLALRRLRGRPARARGRGGRPGGARRGRRRPPGDRPRRQGARRGAAQPDLGHGGRRLPARSRAPRLSARRAVPRSAAWPSRPTTRRPPSPCSRTSWPAASASRSSSAGSRGCCARSSSRSCACCASARRPASRSTRSCSSSSGGASAPTPPSSSARSGTSPARSS